MSDWSQLLDEVSELEPPATLRGRVFAAAQAGPPPPPHRRLRRVVVIAAAMVGVACVVTALVVAAHSRRDRPAPAPAKNPPTKSEPGLSTMAAAEHRVAVAYRDLVWAPSECSRKAVEVHFPACPAAASELRRQIDALRRQVVVIGNAGSAACKLSAHAYDVRLQWLRHYLVNGQYRGDGVIGELYVSIAADRGGIIDACLSSSESGRKSTSGLGKMNDDNRRADVAFNKYDATRLACGGNTVFSPVQLVACVDAAFAAVDLKQKLETLLIQVVTIGEAGPGQMHAGGRILPIASSQSWQHFDDITRTWSQATISGRASTASTSGTSTSAKKTTAQRCSATAARRGRSSQPSDQPMLPTGNGAAQGRERALRTVFHSASRRVARVGRGCVLALVITGMVAACNDASSSESGLSESEPGPSESEPGPGALADADRRVAVAYRDFVLAHRACLTEEATTEADVSGCLAAASELENQIQALRRVVAAIGDAGSDACKKSADAYDSGLRYRWWNVSNIRDVLAAGLYATYRWQVFLLRHNHSSLHVGTIDACQRHRHQPEPDRQDRSPAHY